MNFSKIHEELKDHPSYIDRQYYEKRLQQKADRIYSETTQGLSGNSFLDAVVSLENSSLEAYIGKISHNLPEAKAIIHRINNHADSNEFDENIISWEPIFKQRDSNNTTLSKSMTHSEMINRLEEISNEKLGNEISEWNKWLAAWELYPVPTGSR
jgi:hypothetical protein